MTSATNQSPNPTQNSTSRRQRRKNRPSQGNTPSRCETGWQFFIRRYKYYVKSGWSGPVTVLISTLIMLGVLSFPQLEVPVVTALIWWLLLVVGLNVVQMGLRGFFALRDWMQRRPSVCQSFIQTSLSTKMLAIVIFVAVVVVPVWYGLSNGYIVNPYAKVTTALSEHTFDFRYVADTHLGDITAKADLPTVSVLQADPRTVIRSDFIPLSKHEANCLKHGFEWSRNHKVCTSNRRSLNTEQACVDNQLVWKDNSCFRRVTWNETVKIESPAN